MIFIPERSSDLSGLFITLNPLSNQRRLFKLAKFSLQGLHFTGIRNNRQHPFRYFHRHPRSRLKSRFLQPVAFKRQARMAGIRTCPERLRIGVPRGNIADAVAARRFGNETATSPPKPSTATGWSMAMTR